MKRLWRSVASSAADKRPPLKDGEKRMVREKARELDSDYRVRADRERRGVASDDDLLWLAWHRRDEARAVALLLTMAVNSSVDDAVRF